MLVFYSTTGASNSNFFGQSAGIGATNASYSNFMGQQAGKGNKCYSIKFLWSDAGNVR
jgi:hypothetical protein